MNAIDNKEPILYYDDAVIVVSSIAIAYQFMARIMVTGMN